MFKQVYKFLSILLISNLLFSPAVLSKSQKDPNSQKKSIIQRLFCHKKPAEQKPDNQNTNVQKPTYSDPGGYVTKYGVYYTDDIFDTYPTVKPNDK
ncbi:MAG: hypothetical protein A2287_04470 [Candidatus Melainabacteria bacterium RIFOXYA12_FULL_32_12]|nr:MAG: hypothetical protein A2255_03765 [Candidatus Melainabacteria bacterium RIFOXYA2_FULL_32_9]OGI31728.1 MAG: hypothetical protein A2287_04470 [Candidatus Melainabacteria bacterium RIFOXYA12_FULL_32_12]